MKVLLIKPRNVTDHIQPSLGLLYLASQIRKNHDVAIHDCIKENTKLEEIIHVIEAQSPDVIGIQCFTYDVPNVSRMLKAIKKIFPDIITVVGGAHISSIPLEAYNKFLPDIDYGFNGEAEIGFPRFLTALEHKMIDHSDIEGLIWRDPDGRIIVNEKCAIQNLDELGIPSWDLILPETYPECQHGAFYKKFPIAPIIITRGCPYMCGFCAAPIISGRKIRKHSVEYVQENIRTLYKRGIREIHIVDDNFTFDLDYCKQVLRGIIDLKLDISLATPNGIRMERIDDEVLELMKEAGVYLVSVAAESGSNRILKRMKKTITVANVKQNVKQIQRHGFEIAGFFVIGYPGETKEEIKTTIRFSKQLGLLRANYFTFLPLPGTSIYNEMVEQNKIAKIDWKNFSFMTAPYVPEGMTHKELMSLKRKAFFIFFI